MNKFITILSCTFAGERIFKIDEHLSKLQAKWLIVSYAHSPYTFVLKDAEITR